MAIKGYKFKDNKEIKERELPKVVVVIGYTHLT